MKLLAAALLTAIAALAADADPVDVLIRLRDQVNAHSHRIPNYTCVETVLRDRYDMPGDPPRRPCDDVLASRKAANFSARLRHVSTDRLRLDVALADDHEIYSWAGEAKFHGGDIDELIPEGAMGTGPFAGMLLGVFQGRPPKFLFEGSTTIDHRIVYQYSYSVPREDSRYRVRARAEWVFTAYDATLWVDPQTAELVRMEVRTDELPPETTMCQTITTLDFGMVQLAGNDYLLPKLSRQRFISRDGSEGENRVTFASCREFRGQSTVNFGDTAAGAKPAPPSAAAPYRIPAGIALALDLATDIGDDAAAGDGIRGRVAQTVRDALGHVLVAEGATVEGRLTKVEIRHGAKPESVVALRWDTVEIDGAPRAVSLLPRRRTPVLESVGLMRRGIEIELPPASDSRSAVYHFPGEHISVKAGYRTEWTTTP